ncbi:BT_3044 domain-containing protein [Flavisolibacter ginsenosidimutans]|uniref:DUF4361 domain-containing protein n=1 Tax=Flavisolibacter ginsenosidimutans TaxID=661481 RepID=A0A5B8UJL4_9BACT|nr:DUF4361 domain-containing protein [Flavisolibacter ginsenosidimutans]QEC56864.1 DUF4361 domain-containing protein [Flavisolibacter ginsenosidimutans]
MRLKYLTTTIFAGTLLSGCVKERGVNFANQTSPTTNVANFPNQSETAALDISATPTTYTFYVEVTAANNVIPSGTSVSITKSPAVATAAGFEVLPDSAYQLVNTTATVDPSTHLATFQLKISSTKVAPGHNYGLGFSIASVGNGVTIAGNKNTDAIGITVKNPYDGNYHSNGYFYHPSSPRAITNLAKTLYTVNATTSITTLGDLGNQIYLTVDPATNKVTISDVGVGPGIAPTSTLTALPAPFTPFAGSNPSVYNNTYNPATKTFYLRYGYLGGTGYRVTEEILTHD